MAEALTNQAHEYLYRKIISCEYLPGQELNEKQLLEETSFGRTPLREALHHAQDKPQVALDHGLPGGGIACPRPGEQLPLFRLGKHRQLGRVHPA